MKKVSLVFLLLIFTPAMYLFSTLADTKIEETPNYEQYLNDKIAYQNRDNYLTITQYYQFMEETANNYANICHLITAGTSVQGRPIYFLKITDNPDIEEAEPEFNYISTIHGDEIVGYDLCLRLIQLLTSEYETNSRIVNIVNTTEIWICPLLNPDGYVLNRRNNASNIDLNRNFPLPNGELHPDSNPWAPETIAIMNLFNEHNFVLGGEFHGGECIVYCPWSYTRSSTGENELLYHIASDYSIHNPFLGNSFFYPNNIFFGSTSYPLLGTLNDWGYAFTSSTQITFEIYEVKSPPASELPGLWNDNKEAMLYFLESVHRGVYGLVTSNTGRPLKASISVQDCNKIVYSDLEVGDYYRLLLPGTYNITAYAEGYEPQTVQVTVPLSGSIEYNFALNPAVTVDLKGQFRDFEGNLIPYTTVTLNTIPATNTNFNSKGFFTFNDLMEGYYNIHFSNNNEDIYETNFLLTKEKNEAVFTPVESSLIFYDPCEDLSNWSTIGPWGVTNYQGETVITDSPSGNYAPGGTYTLTLANPISLEFIKKPVLMIKAQFFLRMRWDNVYIQGSTHAENWIDLGILTGYGYAWEEIYYPLNQFSGHNFYLRFVLQSRNNYGYDGIYIDEIKITGIDYSQVIYGDVDSDDLITMNDVQVLLQYLVGFDPVPLIDPLPWSEYRIHSADVDDNEALDSVDAYLISHYIQNPKYRYEVQNGEELELPQMNISFELIENPAETEVLFHLNPPNALNCLNWELTQADSIQNLGIGLIPEQTFLYAFNSEQAKFALINPEKAPLASFSLHFNTNLTDIDFLYNLNGQIGVIHLPTGTNLNDSLTPEISFALNQNYPNPFNSFTCIKFSLPEDKKTFLGVYNIRGQLVKTLINEVKSSGEYDILWDGCDNYGQSVSSGVYFCILKSGDRLQTRKIILIK